MFTGLALAVAYNLAVLNVAYAHPAVVMPGVSGADTGELSPVHATVFTQRDATSTAKQLKEIYCPTRDCPTGRDWLTMRPNPAAGWAVGSIAFLAGGLLVRLRNSFTCYAMLDLGISLFLRAGLHYSHGNKRSIYIASLFFHYNCATVLFVNIMNGAFSVKALVDESKVGRAVASALWSLLLNMLLLAMVIAGVVIMFQGEGVNSGWRLIQAVLYIMVIMMAVSMLVLLKNSCSGGAQATVSLALLFAVVLLTVWSCFMLSRTYVPLTNVTRTSEVAWYLLGVMPLVLIGIVF